MTIPPDIFSPEAWPEEVRDLRRWLPAVIALVWWLLSLLGARKKKAEGEDGRNPEGSAVDAVRSSENRPIEPR